METITLHLSEITLGKNYSRERYTGIEDLAHSIQARGLIHPLVVKAISSKKKSVVYELVSGYRRHLALSSLSPDGSIKVTCSIFTGSPLQAALLNVDENVERREITIWEFACGVESLKQDFGLSLDDLSLHLNKSKGHISNCYSLTQKLCPEVQVELNRGLNVPSSKLFLWKTFGENGQKAALSKWKNETSPEAVTRKTRGRTSKLENQTMRERANKLLRSRSQPIRETAEYILGKRVEQPSE